LRPFTRLPNLNAAGTGVEWQDLPLASGDEDVVRTAAAPFSPSGGLKLLQGNLGRAVIKVSAVPESNHIIEA
ncbi:phosphogluconate dehydratase, partial [Roseateles sp. GG27B]